MTVEALVSCAAVATLLMILVLRLRRGPVPQGVVGGPVDSLPLPPPEPPVSYETTAAPAPASEAAPEAAPAAEKILPWHARLSWPQAKVYQRVRSYEFEQMDGTRSPCTASNATLGQGWYEDGRPAGDRYVRLLLRGLHDAGVLGGWDGAERRHSSSNPTGRGLRTLAGPLPRRDRGARFRTCTVVRRISSHSQGEIRIIPGSWPDHARV